MKPALRDALSRALAASRAARATLADLDTALEEGLQAPVEEGTANASARRAHRPGVLSKLSTDPDLRAFVLARIEALTFDQIANEIGANFPPERRVSRSSLHRWWHRHGRHIEPRNRL